MNGFDLALKLKPSLIPFIHAMYVSPAASVLQIFHSLFLTFSKAYFFFSSPKPACFEFSVKVYID